MADFTWSFPCYVVGKICERGLAFAAPDKRIAIFTDSDLAQRFKDDLHGDDPSFVILPVQSPVILSGFLASVSGDYVGVAVDPDRQKTRAFGFPQVLQSLSREDS